MKLDWSVLLVCFGVGTLATSAYAELILDTQQISLATTQEGAIRKSLRLTTDKEIENLLITPSDLELEDGTARIPATAVKIADIDTPLLANQAKPLELTIASEVLKTNGEFTGTLLVQYDDNSHLIPVTVNVKSRAWSAWLVLLAGVGLGTGLSIYRSNGLPKDELLVRAGELRTQIRDEAAPEAERFKAQVEGALFAVETALSNKEWEAAEASLGEGQTIWNRWRSGKKDWIEQIHYLKELSDQSKQIASSVYAQAVQGELAAIARQLATYETPQVLADQLKPVRAQINRYKQGDAWLGKLSDLSAELREDDQRDEWERKRESLEDNLNALEPKDSAAFEEWLTKVKTAYDDLAHQGDSASQAISERSSIRVQIPLFLPPVPDVEPSRSIHLTSASQRNLTLFRWATPIVTIGIISWLGMAELYEADATFGAAPISDYLGLFAWGFGAEVSRDAIVKALGDLRTPLERKKEEET